MYIYKTNGKLNTWNFRAIVPENRPLDCGVTALKIHFGISLGDANSVFNRNTVSRCNMYVSGDVLRIIQCISIHFFELYKMR